MTKVTIENNVLFAPNVSLFTAGQPIHFEPRNAGIEYAFPITIGDNVVIGSGSVVTKDIPSNSIAVGNPCTVIRKIIEEHKKYYFKNFKIEWMAWMWDMNTTYKIQICTTEKFNKDIWIRFHILENVSGFTFIVF